MNFEQFLSQYQKEPVEEYPNHVLQAVPNPVVSVRVSTYQHAPYIRQCLEGILIQATEYPFEVCIGEDESNDGTREICIEFAKRYPDKIRLFLHKRSNNIHVNGKPSAKFQSRYTIEMCRGKYIAVCEGDDYWIDKNKLQMQIDVMEGNPNVSLCGTRCLVKKQQQGEIGRDMVGSTGDKKYLYTFTDFIRGAVLNTCTVCFRNEPGKTYFPWGSGFVWGDRTRCIGSTMDGSVCHVLPAVTAVYRVTGTGMWSGKKSGIYSHIHDLERYHATLLEVVPENLKPVVREEWVFSHALRLRREKKHRELFIFLIQNPLSFIKTLYRKRKKYFRFK